MTNNELIQSFKRTYSVCLLQLPVTDTTFYLLTDAGIAIDKFFGEAIYCENLKSDGTYTEKSAADFVLETKSQYGEANVDFDLQQDTPGLNNCPYFGSFVVSIGKNNSLVISSNNNKWVFVKKDSVETESAIEEPVIKESPKQIVKTKKSVKKTQTNQQFGGIIDIIEKISTLSSLIEETSANEKQKQIALSVLDKSSSVLTIEVFSKINISEIELAIEFLKSFE